MARRPTSKQQRQIRALIAKLEPQIREAFTEAMRATANSIDYTALLEALDTKDVARAASMLQVGEGQLFALKEAIRGGYVAGGASVSAALPVGVRGGFGFNGSHPRAQAWIAEVGAELVADITRGTIEVARETILQGMRDNVTSREVARSLIGTVNRATGMREGGIIGLDGPRAHRLNQVTSGMRTAEGVADLVIDGASGPRLKYKVNPATERRIIAAYRRGEAVSAADRALSERQLSNKLLKERGETIARHEAHTAQSAGRQEAYTQVLNQDGVEAITLRWQHNGASDPRPDHVAMDGTVINLGEKFIFADAEMEYPHDPAGGIEHSINCHCVAIYRVEMERD